MTSPAVVLEPVHLVLGEEELLVERAIKAVLATARLADVHAESRRIRITDITPAELSELVSPSLFAEGRVVVLDAAQEANAEIAAAVVDYCQQPSEGVALVVVHTGGGRAKLAKELPDKLRKAGARVTQCAKITKPAEREAFLKEEFRRAGGRADAAAIAALIETVGSDLRELASAANQLVADTNGAVDEHAVRRYHRGRAEVTGFVVAEKAVVGDRAGALEALRWALQTGVASVLIADALADAVRTIARVTAQGRVDPFSLASQLGMPPWKVKKALAQARGWEASALNSAMAVVAQLNADVKGAAADVPYALERAVLTLVKLRSAKQVR